MDSKIVLPETLVAELIEGAAAASGRLAADFEDLSHDRGRIRHELSSRRRLRAVPDASPPEIVYAVDGGQVVEIDRASAYAATCAVRVGRDQNDNEQSSCLAVLPHLAGLESIASGLMVMQEIMMATRAILGREDAYCVIDGSKLSTIIALNQFYTSLEFDGQPLRDRWAEAYREDPGSEPGRRLEEFESTDWLRTFLLSPRIVGNVKLVTTTALVEDFAPKYVGRFDDKTLAALVLEPGEVLGPIPLRIARPLHIGPPYPYRVDFDLTGRSLVDSSSQHQIQYLYYRPGETLSVFKIEVNRKLLSDAKTLASVLGWWRIETPTTDLLEPYPLYIADRFAKEAVSISSRALREIARARTASDPWGWSLMQAHRTS